MHAHQEQTIANAGPMMTWYLMFAREKPFHILFLNLDDLQMQITNTHSFILHHLESAEHLAMGGNWTSAGQHRLYTRFIEATNGQLVRNDGLEHKIEFEVTTCTSTADRNNLLHGQRTQNHTSTATYITTKLNQTGDHWI